MSAFGESPGAEQAVVILLCDGRRRPIGFIYANQPLNDGQPIFPEVLAILVRLAARPRSRIVNCAAKPMSAPKLIR